jgi:hypothetical protein
LKNHELCFLLLVVIIVLMIVSFILQKNDAEREKINAMSPAEQRNYLFGPINEHLICLHCQTKGVVHVMRASRVTTTTGKVGGILKTDTTSTATSIVTQHHCEQCGSTWDI